MRRGTCPPTNTRLTSGDQHVCTRNTIWGEAPLASGQPRVMDACEVWAKPSGTSRNHERAVFSAVFKSIESKMVVINLEKCLQNIGLIVAKLSLIMLNLLEKGEVVKGRSPVATSLYCENMSHY